MLRSIRSARAARVLASCAVLCWSVVAHAALSKPSNANVVFHARGPAGLEIKGETSDLDLKEENGSVFLDVRLATLETGIGLRNRHMKDALEVDKFPTVRLTVAKSAFRLPARGESAEGDAPATLTLHGQSKPVTVHWSVRGEASSTFWVTGSFHLDMTEFGITAPSYLGVKVKRDLDVDAKFRVSGS